MTWSLAAALGGLALLDSLNPSALAITLLLMTGSEPVRRAAAYLSGVFLTYLLAGLLILGGLGAVWAILDSRFGYVLQALVGAALLLYALIGPTPKVRPGRAFMDGSSAGLVLVGAGVTAVEFSTAIPYLGALSLLAGSPIAWPGRVGILVLYNVVFVMPPLLIVAARVALGEPVEGHMERCRAWLQRQGRGAMLWLLGIAGFLLLRNGLVMLGLDLGLIDIPALSEGITHAGNGP